MFSYLILTQWSEKEKVAHILKSLFNPSPRSLHKWHNSSTISTFYREQPGQEQFTSGWLCTLHHLELPHDEEQTCQYQLRGEGLDGAWFQER